MDEESESLRKRMREVQSNRRQSREQKQLDRFMLEVEKRDPVLCDQLRSGTGRRAELDHVQKVLVSALRDDNPDVRCHAAWAIGRLAELELAANKRSGLKVLLSALSDALNAENMAPVKASLVKAIGNFGRLYPNEVKTQFLSQRECPDRSVVVAIVDGLASLGMTVVPGLVDVLVDLLQDGPTDVRVAACSALGGIGPEAFKALGPLLLVAFGPAEPRGKSKQGNDRQVAQNKTTVEEPLAPVLQRAAIGAIVRIDTTGDYLVYEIQDRDLRDRILDLLRQLDVSSSVTYQRLHAAWVEAELKGPSAGQQRMQRADILAYIFAPNQPQEKDDRNLSNWMDKRKLRAVCVWKGMYDVNIEDLETLRKLQLSRLSGLDPVAEESGLDQ